MSNQMTATKRFLVRMALVTSTTLTTIMGAQALASIDIPSKQPATVNTPLVTPAATLSNSGMVAVAPNIAILRRAGEQPNISAGVANPAPSVRPSAQIQLPNPVQVAAPQQVIVQQPYTPPVTRSTR